MARRSARARPPLARGLETIWNDEGRSDALIDIAVAGLSRQVDPELPRKHRANTVWRDIWPVLWSAGVRRDDFIAATLSWVAPTSRLPEGIRREIARPLRAEGLLPAELRTAIDGVASRPAISLEQCRQVAQWPAGAPGFLTAWVQCWKCEEARPELVPCALEWLRLNGYQRGFAPTWRDVYDFTGPSEPLLAIGRKWLSSGSPDRTGWGFVFDGVMRSGPSDPQLVQLGGRWLASQFFVRQTWPFVWATLWDLELSDWDRLIRTADAWLRSPIAASGIPSSGAASGTRTILRRSCASWQRRTSRRRRTARIARPSSNASLTFRPDSRSKPSEAAAG